MTWLSQQNKKSRLIAFSTCLVSLCNIALTDRMDFFDKLLISLEIKYLDCKGHHSFRIVCE